MVDAIRHSVKGVDNAHRPIQWTQTVLHETLFAAIWASALACRLPACTTHQTLYKLNSIPTA
jgi:hypothetical protein